MGLFAVGCWGCGAECFAGSGLLSMGMLGVGEGGGGWGFSWW